MSSACGFALYVRPSLKRKLVNLGVGLLVQPACQPCAAQSGKGRLVLVSICFSRYSVSGWLPN